MFHIRKNDGMRKEMLFSASQAYLPGTLEVSTPRPRNPLPELQVDESPSTTYSSTSTILLQLYPLLATP